MLATVILHTRFTALALTVFHFNQRRQKHVRVVAMYDDLHRIGGIEVGRGQIRFLPRLVDVNALPIVRIAPREQIHIDVVVVRAFVVDNPCARAQREIAIGRRSGRCWRRIGAIDQSVG